MISERISYNIPPQLEILNMVIPILMHVCSFISNWIVASHIKPHVIQQNVMQLMTSNYFPQYIAGYTVPIYDIIKSDIALQSQVH